MISYFLGNFLMGRISNLRKMVIYNIGLKVLDFLPRYFNPCIAPRILNQQH